MKTSHILALGLSLTGITAAWEEPPYGDGNFCIRWDDFQAVNPDQFRYAVQIQSEQQYEGLCGGIWANLDAPNQPKCSVRPITTFNGCQPRGQPFVKNGRTMYTTWWWFGSWVTCNGAHVTWVANQAANITLEWGRVGIGSEVKCYDKLMKDGSMPNPESMLNPDNWQPDRKRMLFRG